MTTAAIVPAAAGVRPAPAEPLLLPATLLPPPAGADTPTDSGKTGSCETAAAARRELLTLAGGCATPGPEDEELSPPVTAAPALPPTATAARPAIKAWLEDIAAATDAADAPGGSSRSSVTSDDAPAEPDAAAAAMDATRTLDGGMATAGVSCAIAAATPCCSERKTAGVKAAGGTPVNRMESETMGGCGVAGVHASGEARTSAQRAAARLHTTPGAPGSSALPAAVPRAGSQSAVEPQALPGTQRAQGPPQSASDSPLSSSPSKHAAMADVGVCERLVDGDVDGVCEGVGACDSVSLGDCEAESDGVSVCDGVSVREPVTEGVAAWEEVTLDDSVPEGVCVGVGACEAVSLGVKDAEGEPACVRVSEGVAPNESVCVCVGSCDDVSLGVCEREGVWERVGVADCEREPLCEGVSVSVAVCVAVSVRDVVWERVDVCVCEREPLSDGDPERVSVRERVGVRVSVAVPVAVDDCVRDCESVHVGVGTMASVASQRTPHWPSGAHAEERERRM